MSRRTKIAYLAYSVADYRLCTLRHLAIACSDFAEVEVMAGHIDNLRPEDVSAYLEHGSLAVVAGKPLVRVLDKDGESRLEFHLNLGLMKRLLDRKPDVIIVEGFGRWAVHAFLVKALRPKTKIITSYERTKWTERRNSMPRRAAYSSLSRLVSGFFANGRQTLELLGSLGFDAPILSRRNYTCHEDFFELQPKPWLDGPVRMLVASRLIDLKGVREFIEALGTYPQHSSFLLQIVGVGALEKELRERISALGLGNTVHLLGKVTRPDMLSLLSGCDLAVLPTKGDNWSLSMVEAVAAGKPVATTPYNGVSRDIVIDGENGFVFDVFDPAAIHAFLDRALALGNDYAAMCQRSKDLAAPLHPRAIAGLMADGIRSAQSSGGTTANAAC